MFMVVNKAPANVVDPSMGDLAVVFPETGVYFLHATNDSGAVYVSSLVLPARSKIVPIPQEYVEGLEATTANASEALNTANTAKSTADTAKSTADTAKSTADTAKSTADTAKSTANTAKSTADAAKSMATAAKSTANTAKSTADAAKSTADAIKPDLNEMSETSPKYVANRPCYYVRTETKSFRDIPTSQVLIEETQLYWYGEFANHNIAPYVDNNKKYRFEDETQIYTCKGYRTSGYVYYDIIGNAALVSDYLKLVSDSSGGPVPNTGEDWAYVTYSNSITSSMFSKTRNYKCDKYLYEITENLKTLDPILIPSTIQRVGDDVIINSSTPDSTKKFKITVDDAGTISATEVT